MRKFISPIVNLVSLILAGISFGLAAITAAFNVAGHSIGNYYQLVWLNNTPNTVAIVGFFLICVGTFLLLVNFLPKIRKVTAPLSAVLLVAGGVIALLTPKLVQGELTVYNQPALIALATLLFIAALFSAVVTVLEFVKEK